jgi:hypothetical protein
MYYSTVYIFIFTGKSPIGTETRSEAQEDQHFSLLHLSCLLHQVDNQSSLLNTYLVLYVTLTNILVLLNSYLVFYAMLDKKSSLHCLSQLFYQVDSPSNLLHRSLVFFIK